MILNKLTKFSGRSGPLVLIIMDGIGLGKKDDSNAFYLAKTPFLDKLQSELPKEKFYIELKAHGTAVGLPTDEEMGNSEVGHNAIGGGNVVKQRAALAKEAIESKSLFISQKWKQFISKIERNNKTLHLIGLLSDGYVHSHLSHLIGLLNGARASNVKKVRVHVLFDGRDVPPQSALNYVESLEHELTKINSDEINDYRIASGGGRMRVTMDRYNSDWDMVQRGWEVHVCGFPEKSPDYNGHFKSAKEAINKARELDPDISDQYLPSFVIADERNIPIGIMDDGDGVLLFNFRGDRAIQISRTFDEGSEFKEFVKICEPKVSYFGLLQYDDVLKIPKNYFIQSPKLTDTIVDYLWTEKVPMLSIAETHKAGHCNHYFLTGNRDLRIKNEIIMKNEQKIIKSLSSRDEIYYEVKSDRSETIKNNPKMKAYEVLDILLDEISSGSYKFVRVNFANGDMVGHTGSIEATRVACETVDECIESICDLVDSMNGIVLITADHGNADDMSGRFETAHTLNPVMFAIVDCDYNNEYVINKEIREPQLGNIAATILNLLGYEQPEEFMESLIKFL